MHCTVCECVFSSARGCVCLCMVTSFSYTVCVIYCEKGLISKENNEFWEFLGCV